ncbi:1-phosphofructokinase [Alkaliphilus hydrothermalis]|uniref:Tagatose-6-phosphate kinase n=1 Tax=Alkaliphilus hydrothermalis TaxID=1482730 RepID=A0ABS2NN83_9FIRM|nr:1-phosphofructokinase [Alkaliphilus hydrothermalis]MBM7614398.1 1-phosphofructokinase [Alkaliphilus hydrothermalis]
MITTVTLNPAIDQSLGFEGLQFGQVNRVIESRLEAGGKGINVSKVLKALGEPSTTTGFIGGEAGKWLNQWLKKQEIMTDFVETDVETRTNIKMIDYKSKIITDINHPGGPIKEEYLKILLNKNKMLAQKSKVMVLSGSLPMDVPTSIYKSLVEIANSSGCITILDCEGEALLKSIEAMPFMIKPNIHELENTLKVKISSEADIINYGSTFLDMGVRMVVVSMGEDGAILMTNQEMLKAETIKVEVNSTVGAGDSMVAAFAYGLKKRLDLKEVFKLAIASATLSVSKGTTLHRLEEIQRYRDKVKISRLR